MPHAYDPRCSMCNPSVAPPARSAEQWAAQPWSTVGILGKKHMLYAYTYGLWESYGHPELLLRSRPAKALGEWRLSDLQLGQVLNEFGRQVRDGDPLYPGEIIDLPIDETGRLLRLKVSTRAPEPHYLAAVEAPVWKLQATFHA